MGSGQTSGNENLESDIVIIGGGGAGLAASVAAAEKGAKVILLEKRHSLGGNSVFPEGLFAAESPAQKRMMIDARTDDLFRIAMEFSHWRLNPRIVRAFVNKSGNTIQWLEDKGLRFDWIPALYPNQVPLVWHCLKKGGSAVVEILTKNCQKMGVHILSETSAKKILLNKKGEVSGVLAENKERSLEITAKRVIIASGGYSGNDEMLKKYCPSYTDQMHCVGLRHTGDGIQMAIDVGSATEGLGLLHLSGPRFVGSWHLTAVAQEPISVWVNKYGVRFTDETVTFAMELRGNVVDMQPDKISYTLFDENIKHKIMQEGLIKGVGVLYAPRRMKLSQLDKSLQEEADKGMVGICDSWEQISEWVGVSREVIKETVDEYNASCDRGYDETFAKDRRYLVPLRTPPYYAMKCRSSFLGTIGGIKINEHMEVIDTNDKPIPGLYAAGVDTGGWESDTYCSRLSGATFGFAINSGRIAGENAAEYISENRLA